MYFSAQHWTLLTKLLIYEAHLKHFYKIGIKHLEKELNYFLLLEVEDELSCHPHHYC